MKCNGCGNKYAARIKIQYIKNEKIETCDECGANPVWLPDVFLGNKGGVQTDENLCNEKGQPIPFSSKREKAAIMRMLKLRQSDSAEHEHGFRNEMYLHRKTYFC